MSLLLESRRRPRRVAQVAAALLVTALVAVALYWGFLRHPVGYIANGTRISLDARALADGTVPAFFDTGQPAMVSTTPDDPGATFRVQDHLLTFQPTAEGRAAAYLSTPDMGQPVTSMGARWAFRPGAGDSYGAVALLISQGTQNSIPQPTPAFPVHFVVTALNWNVSVQKNASSPLEEVAAGQFPKPMEQDGTTTYEAKLTIDGGQLTIDLSNGTHRVVKDPRISEWQGNYATFELFSNNGIADSIAGFRDVWADSTVASP